MKNFILPLVFVFVVSEILCYFLPWWSVLPAGILTGILWPNSWRTTLAAFTGVFILWVFHAFLADQSNLGLLSAKVGMLFKGLNSAHLLLITGLIGGLPAASGAWTGALLRRAMPIR